MTKDCIATAQVSQLKVIDLQAPRAPKVGRGIKKSRFIKTLPAQLIMIPWGLESALPKDHMVFDVIELVRGLDIPELMFSYERKVRSGRPPFDPRKLLTLVIYCYMHGLTSCREIQRAAMEWLPCMMIMGNNPPNRSTVGRFMVKLRKNAADIFQEALHMACELNLVDLEHVAIDGTKILANASKAKSISYEYSLEKVVSLPLKIEALRAELQSASGEQAQELEREFKRQEKRLSHMQTAKATLEQRAIAEAACKAAIKEKKQPSGKKPRGSKRKVIDPSTVKPAPNAQYNPTDPESRLMSVPDKTFEQAYNAQVAVDKKAQLIVANSVVIEGNDKRQLVPMVQQIFERFGRNPLIVSADSGFCSEEALAHECLFGILLRIATPPAPKAKNTSRARKLGQIQVNKMRALLETRPAKDDYAQRKAIVEPVFGHIKSSVMGFDCFSWRGLEAAQQQWHFVCAVHNMLKIIRATRGDTKQSSKRAVA